ncbi:MAG TPA: YggS family pyridoxal phosphate-dependent enzyme, partial [Planctomycetaceae bacterium]|nr:YggS family pyridoxal phosphate-dependent enzyme [Planctomycetaceae bacterium]
MPAVEWHLIGHLQRNKVQLALRHAALIHSVDSLRLLQSIAAGAVAGRRPAVLLQ